MTLTPTQLTELQDISIVLADDFPSNVDQMWDTAMRIQQADLGPLGPGGLPVFEATVADIKLTQEQIQTVQGRNAGDSTGFREATLSVIPAVAEVPPGGLGDTIYVSTAPSVYSSTSVLSLDPAGPNSVTLSEVATAVARTVPPASGGIEINNLLTGAGFERALTTSDLGLMLPTGTVSNAMLSWNGAAWVEQTRIQGVSGFFQLTDATFAQQVAMNVTANDFNMSYANITDMNIGGGGMSGNFNLSSPLVMSAFATLYFNERATALGDTAGQGQFWVRNDSPNVPMFTDDTGVDIQLGAGFSFPIQALDNEEIQFGTGNDWQFVFDGTEMFMRRATAATDHLVVESSTNGDGATLELRQTVMSPECHLWFTNNNTNEGFDIAFSPSAGSLLFYAGNDAFAQQQLKMLLGGGAANGVQLYTDASLLRLETRTQGTQFTQGIYMIEMAAAGADITGSGQLWTRNDAPNTLMFTDDVGNDITISIPFASATDGLAPASGGGTANFLRADGSWTVPPGAGAQISGTPVNNQLAIWTNATTIEGDTQLTFDGTVFTFTTSDVAIVDVVPKIRFEETGLGADLGNWLWRANGGDIGLYTATDAAPQTVVNAAILAERGTTTQVGAINLLVGAGETALRAAANVGVDLYYNNIPRWLTQPSGVVAIRSDTSTDAEVRRIDFEHQDGTLRGLVGHQAGASDFNVQNRIDSGNLLLTAFDAASASRVILTGDPDAITQLRGDTQVTIGLGPIPETGATFVLGGAVALYYNDATQFETDILGARVRDTLYVGNPGGGDIKINESASADVDEAGFGQIWVQDFAPNMLAFTGDTGVDQTVNFAGCRLANADGAQSVATGSSYAPLSWGTTPAIETHSGFYDEATNDERIVIPTGMGGTYIITGGVLCNTAGNADGTYWAIGVSVNGARVAEAVDSVDMSTVAFPNVGYVLNVTSGPIVLAAADFIELETTTDDTGSIGISTAGRTFFTVQKIA